MSIKRKITALVVTFAMLFSMMPGMAFASESVNLDLANGSIAITETGYKQGDAAEETAHNGAYIITQTGTDSATTNSITVSGTQDITLNGVNIDTRAASPKAAAITIMGTVNLTLTGDNAVTSADNFAGVQVEEGASLTIVRESTGTLTAIGGHKAAGIGGGNGKTAGTIIINGGTINATGGANDPNTSYSGAGIGGGYYGHGGTITINGGKVTANGNRNGAGIGGGMYGDNVTITINGGEVNAYSVKYGGAGIGGGYNGDGGVITITDGKIIAKGSEYSAGIGGCSYGKSGIITISGGYVEATGVRGPGIGNGESSRAPADTDKITISGKDTVVKAWGGGGSAGIGGAWNANNPIINIDGATVYAYGGERGTGIGAGQFEYANPITITNGANVTAIGGIPGDDSYYGAYGGGAGIGSGSGVDEATYCGTITITDSTVYAKGGSGHKDSTAGGGAGIGSAGGGASATGIGGGGNIIITNSNIEAIGGDGGMNDGGAAGIGGGSNGGVSGNITIIGGTIKAVGGKGFEGGTGTGAGAGIGGGSKGGVGDMVYTHDSNGSATSSTPVAATISISGAVLTATGGEAIGEDANGAGFGVGTGGNDVEGSIIEVSCGTYSDIDIAYVSDDASAIQFTTTNGDTTYYVGEDIEKAVENAESGDSIDVIKGDNLELDIKSEGVTVSNNSEGTVIVNGEEVARGESVETEESKDDEVTDNKYDIVNGEKQTVTNDKEAVFVSNADFSKFVEVKVDGKTVDKANYTVAEGSTKVTLKADYVKTLSEGKHTLTIVSTDGEASTEFTVKAMTGVGTTATTETIDKTEITTPKTGDESNIAVYILTMLLALAIGTKTVILRKEK